MKIADLKTWRDADQFLKMQLKKFRDFDHAAVFPVKHAPLTYHRKMVLDACDKPQLKLDLIISGFILSGKWPELTKVEKYCLYCRLRYALKVLSLLIGPRIKDKIQPIHEPTLAGADLLRWLLQQTWQSHGEADWNWSLERYWQFTEERENRRAELDREYDAHFQIVSIRSEERTDGPTIPKEDATIPGLKTYRCVITLRTGEKYAVWMPAVMPPTLAMLQTSFRTERHCYEKLD